MKNIFKVIGILLLTIILFMGIGLGAGWFKVGYTKTVGKAQQDANTEVFEHSNAFIKAKRQEAIKAYKEYNATDNEREKKAIAYTISMSLADFDEDKHINDLKLRSWIKKVKY